MRCRTGKWLGWGSAGGSLASAGAAMGTSHPRPPQHVQALMLAHGHWPAAPPGATVLGGTQALSQPRPTLHMPWLLFC